MTYGYFVLWLFYANDDRYVKNNPFLTTLARSAPKSPVSVFCDYPISNPSLMLKNGSNRLSGRLLATYALLFDGIAGNLPCMYINGLIFEGYN
jgi:hypothetical protein